MNNWTISRRILVGFISVLSLTLLIGGFSLLRVSGLKTNIIDIVDNTIPSFLCQFDIKSNTYDAMVAFESITPKSSADDREKATKQMNDFQTKADEAIKKYESLLSDEKDKGLYNDEKSTRDTLTALRQQAIDLFKAGKFDDENKLFTDQIQPAFAKALSAVEADIAYNNELGTTAGNTAKAAANSSFTLLSIALIVAIVIASGLAFQVIRAINKALGAISTSLDEGAQQTASAAGQISSSSQSLSTGSSEQASSIEETSTALEEISTMIRTTAENAQKAKSLASDARSVAETGSAAMSEMSQAMHLIDSSSGEVAKIVKNIDEIAFQTNILALNAAVEAARAGEAGAGFAVVADEVRSLAQRSAAAAKETAEKIEAAITNSKKGSQCSERVNVALTQITQKVAATDGIVAEIATAAREQAQGIEQINSALANMDKISQSNSSNAEESAAAAEQLDAQASNLNDLVARLVLLVTGKMTSTERAHHERPRSRSTASAPAHKKAAAASAPKRKAAIPMPDDSSSSLAKSDSFKKF
jgi:methyl-accepting chemotaxis protein